MMKSSNCICPWIRNTVSETDKDERPNKVLEDKLEFKKDLKYKKGDVIVSGITSEAGNIIDWLVYNL